MIKLKLMPTASMSPQELYDSNLTSWGIAELMHLFSMDESKSKYWAYPVDCFCGEDIFDEIGSDKIKKLESLEQLKEEL